MPRHRLPALSAWLVVAFGLGLSSGCNESDRPGGDDCQPVRYPQRNQQKVTIDQGIWGDVWFWEGDFMPPCPTGTVTAVEREMRVHALTSLADVVWEPASSFISEIHTELVATVFSDDDGFFEVVLPAGTYSLFAVEDTLFYANGFDGQGNIFPVEVAEGQASGVLFPIDHLSTW
jgi:hypothetical protein